MPIETEYQLNKTDFNSIETGEKIRIFSFNPKNKYFEDTTMIKNNDNECFVDKKIGIIQEKRGFVIPKIIKQNTIKIS